MLNLTLTELRLITKRRNIDSHQNTSKNQLINLITTPKATLIKKFINKLSKRVTRIVLFYNSGSSSSKIKDEFYEIVNKYSVNKFKIFAISKYEK